MTSSYREMTNASTRISLRGFFVKYCRDISREAWCFWVEPINWNNFLWSRCWILSFWERRSIEAGGTYCMGGPLTKSGKWFIFNRQICKTDNIVHFGIPLKPWEYSWRKPVHIPSKIYFVDCSYPVDSWHGRENHVQCTFCIPSLMAGSEARN